MDNLTSVRKEMKDTEEIKVDRGNMKIQIKPKTKAGLECQKAQSDAEICKCLGYICGL